MHTPEYMFYPSSASAILPDLEPNAYRLIYADVDYGLDLYEDEDYEDFLWLDDAKRLILPGGSLALHVHPSQVGRAQTAAEYAGFVICETVIWRYFTRNGQSKHALAPEYEPICLFSVGVRQVFHPERCMVPNLHPGAKTVRGEQTYTAGTHKLPGDVWDDIPRVHGQSPERCGFICQKPERLMERLILLLTEPGDRVLDPRVGTGTTLAVARRLGRRGCGIEHNDTRYRMACERLAKDWQPHLAEAADAARETERDRRAG